MNLKNQLAKLSVVSTGAVLGASQAFAQATGPDMTGLTDSISFGTIIAAVLAVTALAIGVKLAFFGGKEVKKSISN